MAKSFIAYFGYKNSLCCGSKAFKYRKCAENWLKRTARFADYKRIEESDRDVKILNAENYFIKVKNIREVLNNNE